MATQDEAGVFTNGPMPSRRMKWLLIVSLALNLLVVGAVASLLWRGRPAVHILAASGGGNLASYVGSLPNERRRDLFARGQPQRQQMMALRSEVRAARRDMLAALAAEPFDKQRYIDAQARLLDVEVRQRTAMRPWLAEIAAGMSQEERRAFLTWRWRDRPGHQRSFDEFADPPKQ